MIMAGFFSISCFKQLKSGNRKWLNILKLIVLESGEFHCC